MLLDAPTPGIVGEISEDEFDGASEGVVTVVGGDQDAIFPKPNEVTGSITSDVADETDVFFDAPSPCIVTEVFDRSEGMGTAVAEYDDSILAEAYGIGKARARDGDWTMG